MKIPKVISSILLLTGLVASISAMALISKQTPARAGLWAPDFTILKLDVQNLCPRPIRLAVHYDDFYSNKWRTKGWWFIDSGRHTLLSTQVYSVKKRLSESRLLKIKNGRYYYYAETTDNGRRKIWNGNNYVYFRGKRYGFRKGQSASRNPLKLTLRCPPPRRRRRTNSPPPPPRRRVRVCHHETTGIRCYRRNLRNNYIKVCRNGRCHWEPKRRRTTNSPPPSPRRRVRVCINGRCHWERH